MAKKKQPYIPFYTGDYLKDTRTLSLEAKGAWIDIIVFMWDSETRGIIEGDLYDISRMIGASVEETDAVLKEFCRKKICEISEPSPGMIRIISRRLMKEAELSEKRSIAVQTRYKTSTKAPTKNIQTPDIDSDNDIVIENKIKEPNKKIKHIPEVPRETIDERITNALDEIYIEQCRMKWKAIDFDLELFSFIEKVRGSPDQYNDRDTGGLRLAFQFQLRNAKKKQPNGKPFNKNDRTQQNLNDLARLEQHIRDG